MKFSMAGNIAVESATNNIVSKQINEVKSPSLSPCDRG